MHTTRSLLQCYSVLSDIWMQIELCIPLESESSVLSTCNAFGCLSTTGKLKFAVLFCSICKGLISFSASIAPYEDQHQTSVISKAIVKLDLCKVLCWSLDGAVSK